MKRKHVVLTLVILFISFFMFEGTLYIRRGLHSIIEIEEAFDWEAPQISTDSCRVVVIEIGGDYTLDYTYIFPYLLADTMSAGFIEYFDSLAFELAMNSCKKIKELNRYRLIGGGLGIHCKDANDVYFSSIDLTNDFARYILYLDNQEFFWEK